MKQCKNCKLFKPFECFSKSATNKDKLRSECKECCASLVKEWRKNNTERYKESVKEWRKNNAENHKEYQKDYQKEWRKNNAESHKAYARKWQKNNAGMVNSSAANRRAAKLQATPYWANLYLIQKFYIEAKSLEKVNHEKYHVDHIHPLVHPLICGLHVPANLHIITEEENLRKNNKFIPYVDSEGNPNIY